MIPEIFPAPKLRPLRLLLLLLGILAGQAVLYGPSLIGSKILLPLDLLAQPHHYLPRTAETARIIPHNRVLADLVEGIEQHRRFYRKELQAGRLPRWNPYQYAGAPYATPKLSPFYTLGACFDSPKVIPWVQFLAALVAGTGAYAFFKRSLGVGVRPAMIVAWCYPLTAFFVLWQGFPLEYNTVWLPWMLFAVDGVVRRASAPGVAALGLLTGLTLVSGQIDVAGQVLLACGLYAVWCFLDAFHKQWFTRRALVALGAVTLGWGMGFLLAAPDILPALEYTRTGERMMERFSDHVEERPPVGLEALPQVAMPTMYGSMEKGSHPIFPAGQRYLPESAAAAYVGLLALLLVAPLSWFNRQKRGAVIFFAALGFFALGWTLDVPGIVTLLRLPGLNMMSHNRLVFATAFSILALTALGLDALERGAVERRRWFLLPAALLAGMLLWCAFRTMVLPEPIRSQLVATLIQQHVPTWIRNADDVDAVQGWFQRSYFTTAVLCGIGLLGWLFLWRGKAWKPRWTWALGGLLAGELLWFGYGRSAQCDPALYFPPIPALEELRKSEPGRMVGMKCLPANMNEALCLPSIQGYDAVNPARLMDVLRIGMGPDSRRTGTGMVQFYEPKLEITPPDGVRLPPVLDMLNVRYVVFRRNPPADIHPPFQSPDYWVLVNRRALPRAFVPRRVETVLAEKTRLARLAAPAFDAREVAFVESPVPLSEECKGSARVVDENPCRVTLCAQMETPGLVVLADLWDPGWRALLDGKPVPILRANHALRGVVAPAGTHTLEFCYEPASVAWGWRLAAGGGAMMAGLLLLAVCRIKRGSP